jgi:hypothetical protein
VDSKARGFLISWGDMNPPARNISPSGNSAANAVRLEPRRMTLSVLRNIARKLRPLHRTEFGFECAPCGFAE